MYKTYKTPQGTYYIGDRENNGDVEVPPESIPIIPVKEFPSIQEQFSALRKAIITGDKTDIIAMDSNLKVDNGTASIQG